MQDVRLAVISRRCASLFFDGLILLSIFIISQLFLLWGAGYIGSAVGVLFILTNFFAFRKSVGKWLFGIDLENINHIKLLIRNLPGAVLGILLCLPNEIVSSFEYLNAVVSSFTIILIFDKFPVIFSRNGSILDHLLKVRYNVNTK